MHLNFKLNGLQFRAGIWPTLITLVLIPVLISLGVWQLDRATQKKNIYEEYLARQERPPVDINKINVVQNPQQHFWRNIIFRGSFTDQIHILLDNQVNNGIAGYFVYTPFKLENTGYFILVNRGWLPAGTDRSMMPEIKTIPGKVTYQGIIKDVPPTGILLSENNIEQLNNKVYRVNKIDFQQIEILANIKLLPFIIRINAPSGEGFTRNWQLPGSGENKHLGYAFQWFALAILLLVIFIFVNLNKTIVKTDERAKK